jgi:ribosomal protein S27E
MEINCIGCGFKVDLAAAYDDYVGQIKCFACGAIMEIETHGGNVLAVNAVTAEPLPSAEVFVVRSVE